MYPATWAAKTPGKPAVVVAGEPTCLTYSELERRSAQLARRWREHGLTPGDTVALLSHNDPACFVVYWAAMRAGLYLTAVNSHLSPEEISYIVNDCDARCLVVSNAVADLATAVVGDTPGIEIRLVFGGDVDSHTPLDDWIASADPAPFPDEPRGADMLYSSGTTGRPKGVRPPLPDRQVSEPGDVTVAVFGAMYSFDDTTVYLSPAPIYHAAPLRFAAAVQALGGTVVIMRRFDAAAALEAIEEHAVTHSQWVPTMFVRLLRLPDDTRDAYDLSSVRYAIHAGAPCPPEVKRRMLDWWGPVLHEYYSSTEANGITFIGPEEWQAHPGSVGRAGIGILHICSDAGDELPTGDVGLVYFERDQMPFSYHKDTDRTRAAQHPAHPTWTTTGDLGFVDQDGYLYLTDRKAFMIISGGVNIYPQEIEDRLALHPVVDDVAVVGVPDPEMGETVLAVVVLRDGHAGDPAAAAALIAHVRESIAGYKAPRAIAFVDTLPRSPTGKLRKGEVRDRFRAHGLADPAVVRPAATS